MRHYTFFEYALRYVFELSEYAVLYPFVISSIHHHAVPAVTNIRQQTFFIKLLCGSNCIVYALLFECEDNVQDNVLYGILRFLVQCICGFQLEVQF